MRKCCIERSWTDHQKQETPKLVRTNAETVRVQVVQGVAQLCRRHNLALCGVLLLLGMPLLSVKLAEQICQARYHIIALHMHIPSAHASCATHPMWQNSAVPFSTCWRDSELCRVALCEVLLLPGMSLLIVKIAEQICQACHHTVAQHRIPSPLVLEPV